MTDKKLLLREEIFHDAWADSIDVTTLDVIASMEGSTAPENRFILEQLGDLKGKRVLDLGCGAGESAVYFALQGAECVASDLSPGMLNVVKRLAAHHGVKVETVAGDAASDLLDATSFDVVYSANTLHHVDTNATLKQMHRLLKPSGQCATWDPLKHNPLINIYRRMATQVRTEDEHPLHINFIETVKEQFDEVTYDCFWYATLWIFVHFYLVERIHPNEERYWKKIIREEARLRPMFEKLEKVDRWVKRIPLVKPMGWNIAMVATKQSV